MFHNQSTSPWNIKETNNHRQNELNFSSTHEKSLKNPICTQSLYAQEINLFVFKCND